MPLPLCGKTVIVTGANAGVGFQTARQLYDLGATVVLAARNEGRGTAAAAAIGGGDRAKYLPLDLATFSSVESFVRKFHDFFGRGNLHGLVCSAGMNSDGAKLQSTVTDDRGSHASGANGNLVFRVNFTSHALLAFLLLDDLRASGSKQDPSHIVTVSSHMHCFCGSNIEWQSLASDPNASAYSQSKLALLLFARALHRREGPNVVCTSVNPGAVASQIWRNSASLIQVAAKWLFLSPAEGARPAVAPFVNSLSSRMNEGKSDGFVYMTPYVDVVSACGLSSCVPLKFQAMLEASAGKLLTFQGPQPGRTSKVASDPSEAERLFQAATELTSFEFRKANPVATQ